MYITKNTDVNFDWDTYFANKDKNNIPEIDYKNYFENNRQMLQENNQLLGVELMKLIRKLTKEFNIEEPEIIEFGAGTGYLSRTLMSMYGGKTTMVDSCEESYKAFKKVSVGFEDKVDYELNDIFKYSSDKRYDIACSFGVIEHFIDKDEILRVHI